MTVLPGTSQTVFMIDSVRYSCYTNEENRIIAEIMFDEEYCYIFLHLCSEENDELRIQKQKYEAQYIQGKKYNNELQSQLDSSLNLAEAYYSAYKETNYKLDRRNNLLRFSGGANVVLLLLLVIL